jgi:hypothetical protein
MPEDPGTARLTADALGLPKKEFDDDGESFASSTIGDSETSGRPRRVRGPKNKKAAPIDQQAALVKTISDIVAELLVLHKSGKTKDMNLQSIRQLCAKRNGMTGIPKLTQIIAGVPEQYKKQLMPLLRAKPVRTASGIAVVAVMSKPHRCPHIAVTGGVCIYCPGGPDSDFEYSTQSYTGYEPTSMRAIRARYDPYLQTKGRIDQLQKLGHSTDKVEFILMGGTFMSLDEQYRDYFIRNLHDALSGHTSNNVEEAVRFSEQSISKSPPSRTNWTRLVPPSVLTGHVSSLRRAGASASRSRRARTTASARTSPRCSPTAAPASKSACRSPPPPPLPSRTNWTSLVPLPVLTGHAASLTPY